MSAMSGPITLSRRRQRSFTRRIARARIDLNTADILAWLQVLCSRDCIAVAVYLELLKFRIVVSDKKGSLEYTERYDRNPIGQSIAEIVSLKISVPRMLDRNWSSVSPGRACRAELFAARESQLAVKRFHPRRCCVQDRDGYPNGGTVSATFRIIFD